MMDVFSDDIILQLLLRPTALCKLLIWASNRRSHVHNSTNIPKLMFHAVVCLQRSQVDSPGKAV